MALPALSVPTATHEVFVARRGPLAVGRVFAAVDAVLNAQRGRRAGHLSLFECVNDADVARGLRLLYGGSVKPDNVKSLMAQVEVDGALVGGAALDANSFASIVNF